MPPLSAATLPVSFTVRDARWTLFTIELMTMREVVFATSAGSAPSFAENSSRVR